MAEIFPFRAWRYDAERFPLASVLTQPYDKITPAMQERYYQASEHNLVRVVLGRAQPGDDRQSNVYTRAAGFLRAWRESGALRQDAQPSIYVYAQEFQHPVKKQRLRRSGFIALGRICDYSEGVVFRHEQTLAKPKADRLELLRATRTHCGQIFMLYRDKLRELEPLLAPATPAGASLEDEYGVRHLLWRVSGPEVIAKVQAAMRQKQLIIADGHHRYETALNFRNECRQAAGKNDANAPYERVMMTFINLEGPGVVILPTHRVVRGVEGERARNFEARAAEFFRVRPLKELHQALDELAAAGEDECRLVVASDSGFRLLNAQYGALAAALPSLSTRQRKLDVAVLHGVILEKLLGLTAESMCEQQNVTYFRDAVEAVAQVRAENGKQAAGQLAFLMNPVKVEQMSEVALAGELMPQKSTDFYPKLLSGLAIYALE